MTQELEVDRIIRQRIRTLRQNHGWSLESLANKASLSVSTLSRIETGSRRIALDQLVPLAKALGTSLDELVATSEAEIIIRPEPISMPGVTLWKLSTDDAVNGVNVSKMRIDPTQAPAPSDLRIHPGKEWFTVLLGEVQLRLGDRTYHVKAGQSAQFDTMTPHAMWAKDGVAEILGILDSAGQKAHQHDTTA
ncbi:helix-turn-helix transcriptional regulator [Glutamicibacter sp. JC586]|uniref:helix-turn-helix domain-containing protein n=1 Tax=Glutamicibacter sp. JC586 TaxID=2590552 RepID=UPI0013576910|nr:helix-turn-helix transcriptional regulator [Glutamicibacter sp. JC586]